MPALQIDRLRWQTRLTTLSLLLYLIAASWICKSLVLILQEEALWRWVVRVFIISAADCTLAAVLCAGLWFIGHVAARRRGAWKLWRFSAVGLVLLVALYQLFCTIVYRRHVVEFPTFDYWMMVHQRGAHAQLTRIFDSRYWNSWMLVMICGAIVLPLLVRQISWLKADAARSGRLLAGALIVTVLLGPAAHFYTAHKFEEGDCWYAHLMESPPWLLVRSMGEAQLFAASDLENQPSSNTADLPQEPALKASSESRQAESLPNAHNVVVLSLRGVSADHLRMYGGKFNPMPLLESAAGRGVVCDQVYSLCPEQNSSELPLLTGLEASHRYTTRLRGKLSDALPWLLSRQGYRIGCATPDALSPDDDLRRLFTSAGGQVMDSTSWPPQRIAAVISDQDVMRQAVDWIDSGSAPFYLAVMLDEVEEPRSEFEAESSWPTEDKKLIEYLNRLELADQRIGWLLEQLQQRGLDDSTLLVVTAEAGKASWRHRNRRYAATMGETCLQVPLVLLHPSLESSNRRAAGPAGLMDVAPTILNLLGFQTPAAWRGRDLLAAPSEPSNAPVYFASFYTRPTVGLRQGDHKFLYFLNSGECALYDLAQDPRGAKNLAPAHSQLCATYRRRALDYLQQSWRDPLTFSTSNSTARAEANVEPDEADD